MSIVRAATMITRDRLGQSALIENVAQVRETDLRNDEDAHVAEFREKYEEQSIANQFRSLMVDTSSQKMSST